jgi:leader peptidase (prepilin peptidase) / N-methyltransferase
VVLSSTVRGEMFVATGSLTLLCVLSAALAWIDFRKGIIPNWLNVAIATLGLSKALLWAGAPAALNLTLQAVAIWTVVWLLRWLYFKARGVQGLGLGDVKFLAAAGIWIGIAGLPTLLLIATLLALATVALLLLSGKQMAARTAMPFGPFLAIALIATVVLQQFA